MDNRSVIMYDCQPPRKVNGTPVEYHEEDKTEFRNAVWVTLYPVDDNDTRLWEFCLDDGRIIRTT